MCVLFSFGYFVCNIVLEVEFVFSIIQFNGKSWLHFSVNIVNISQHKKVISRPTFSQYIMVKHIIVNYVIISQLKKVISRHISSQYIIHEGKRYPCNLCQYEATRKDELKRHIKSIHEGVTYPCHLCGYRATLNRNLRKHIQTIHEGKGNKKRCSQLH